MAKTKTGRNSHGDGSVYKNKDGYWITQITIGKNEDGTQKRKVTSSKTEAEAVKKKRDLLYKLSQGEIVDPNKKILSEWMLEWLENYKKNSIVNTTYWCYETLIKTHICNSTIGKIQIQKLTTDNIQKFMSVLSQKGKTVTKSVNVIENGVKVKRLETSIEPLANATINKIFSLISASLKKGVQNGMLIKNVAENCEKYKNDKTIAKPLSKEEAKKMLEIAKKNRLYALFVLGLYTGFRRGELLGLKWENVDFTNNTIGVIVSLVSTTGNQRELHDPKNESSVRTIAVPPEIMNVLHMQKFKQDNDKERIKKLYEKHNKNPKYVYEDDNFVFAQLNGKSLAPKYVRKVFKKIVTSIGCKNTRLHDLRHTFITNLINVGVDIKTAQSFSGHADTRMLLDRYAHQIKDAQKLAVAKMAVDLP